MGSDEIPGNNERVEDRSRFELPDRVRGQQLDSETNTQYRDRLYPNWTSIRNLLIAPFSPRGPLTPDQQRSLWILVRERIFQCMLENDEISIDVVRRFYSGWDREIFAPLLRERQQILAQ